MMRVLSLLLVLIAVALPLEPPPEQRTLLHWSYPYNDSTYRIYTAHEARIEAISELGRDGFQEFDGPEPKAVVVLAGDADEGDILLRTDHPTCWSVEIRSDYILLNWTRRSHAPCYRAYLPIVRRDDGG
jgi:hypothetical protein